MLQVAAAEQTIATKRALDALHSDIEALEARGQDELAAQAASWQASQDAAVAAVEANRDTQAEVTSRAEAELVQARAQAGRLKEQLNASLREARRQALDERAVPVAAPSPARAQKEAYGHIKAERYGLEARLVAKVAEHAAAADGHAWTVAAMREEHSAAVEALEGTWEAKQEAAVAAATLGATGAAMAGVRGRRGGAVNTAAVQHARAHAKAMAELQEMIVSMKAQHVAVVSVEDLLSHSLCLAHLADLAPRRN